MFDAFYTTYRLLCRLETEYETFFQIPTKRSRLLSQKSMRVFKCILKKNLYGYKSE